jgi:hypothetical protein
MNATPTEKGPHRPSVEALMRQRSRLRKEGQAIVDQMLEHLAELEALWLRWEPLHTKDRTLLSHLNAHGGHPKQALRTLTEVSGLGGELRAKVSDVCRAFRVVRGQRLMASRRGVRST